jgi:hypothetical protein
MAEVFGDGDEGYDDDAGQGSNDDREYVEEAVFREMQAGQSGEEGGTPGG